MNKKIVSLAMIIITFVGDASAKQQNSIDIINSNSLNKHIVAVNGNKNHDVIKRLTKLDDLALYAGDCNEVAQKVKRQIACVSTTENDISITVPTSHITNNTKTISINTNDPIKKKLRVADEVYKSITGQTKSIFDTSIAYISKNNNNVYTLRVANYDGSDSRTLHRSKDPILSPSWSPNGKYISYVSYESIRSAIIIQEVKTGRRIKLLNLKGLNAYPSFKDDKTILVSLSGESNNSEIYSLDVITQKLTLLRKSKQADIFPRRFDEHSYIKVSLNNNNLAFGYEVKGNKQKLITNKQLNAVSASNEKSIVGLSGSDLVFLQKNDEKWEKAKLIASNKTIESPSISRNGKIIYYSIKENNRVFVKASLNTGKNVLSFMIKDEDLIQVSAY